ncbi:hypothetical protein CCP1ISM_3020003 [Azospirillaceae bacterium]
MKTLTIITSSLENAIKLAHAHIEGKYVHKCVVTLIDIKTNDSGLQAHYIFDYKPRE